MRAVGRWTIKRQPFQIENHTEKSCKRALTTDSEGYFYVTDYTAGKIYKFNILVFM